MRCLQNVLSRYPWDDECVDSTEIPKKGRESVGVARQYCGAYGKAENCQAAVFASLTSSVGYGLLEGRLYLPKIWLSPEYEPRWNAGKIPEGTQFARRIEITRELLRRQDEQGIFHARWVGCDAFFGVDSAFRDELAAAGKLYLAGIKSMIKAWRGNA